MVEKDMTEREKLAAGLLYNEMVEGLAEDRVRARDMIFELNKIKPSDRDSRLKIIKDLFTCQSDFIWLEGPVYCSYGYNVHFGNGVYANFNLMLIDDNTITIGSGVLIGPNVVICTASHPVDADLRLTGRQFGLPIVIEDKVWIGANVTINPGVTIGAGAVIGSGSVVTKDIPPNVVAFGSPCNPVREITERDKEYLYGDVRVNPGETLYQL